MLLDKIVYIFYHILIYFYIIINFIFSPPIPITGELVNLKNHTLRMKEKFWPDWDQCLDP